MSSTQSTGYWRSWPEKFKPVPKCIVSVFVPLIPLPLICPVIEKYVAVSFLLGFGISSHFSHVLMRKLFKTSLCSKSTHPKYISFLNPYITITKRSDSFLEKHAFPYFILSQPFGKTSLYCLRSDSWCSFFIHLARIC